MVTKETVITNPMGLHARPATQLVQLCQKFSSDIQIVNGDIIINPKSVFSILAGELNCGTAIEVIAEGEDEKDAVQTIVELLESLED